MTKRDLRRRLKNARDSLPTETKEKLERHILEHLFRSDLCENASGFLLYAPIGSEINIMPLAKFAAERNLPVGFPVCDPDTKTLSFRVFKPGSTMEKGAYGIPVPPDDAPLFVPDERTLCVVPALGFDRKFHRIGYGGGYYDRFLKTFPGVTVGLTFEKWILETVFPEEHDLPLSCLVTERGLHENLEFADRLSKFAPKEGETGAKEETKSDEARDRKPTAPQGRKAPLRLAVKPRVKGPSTLLAAVFLLLVLASGLQPLLTGRVLEGFAVILLQLSVFLTPCIVYLRLRGANFRSSLRLRGFRPARLWFLFCLFIVMVSGSLLASILTGGISSLAGNFTLYEAFTARSNGRFLQTVYLLLAYVILPSVGEEFLFRGILSAEYKTWGVGVSLVLTSLFFAMIHFSFPLFLHYLLLGFLLGFARYALDSLFASLILHLAYNLFALYGRGFLSAFYVNAGGNETFVFLLGVSFLLFLAFALGEARKFYHLRAKAGAPSDDTVSAPIKEYPRRIFAATAAPGTVVILILWLTLSILHAVKS